MFKSNFINIVVILLSCGRRNHASWFNDDNDNYPLHEDKPRPCMQVKFTVRYESKICIPDGHGGWEKSSEENCKGPFKQTCPEFNQAECMWYEATINGMKLKFPTCRLKYYAKEPSDYSKFTWFEVMYVNQYGTGNFPDRPFFILELHRLVQYKNKEYIPGKKQPDFPENVFDKTKPKGLKWDDVDKKFEQEFNGKQPEGKKLTNIKPQELCKDNKDTNEWCKNIFEEYVTFLVKIKLFGHYTGNLPQYRTGCGKYPYDPLHLKDICRVVLWMKIANDFTQDLAEYQLYEQNGTLIYKYTNYGGNSIDREGHLVR